MKYVQLNPFNMRRILTNLTYSWKRYDDLPKCITDSVEKCLKHYQIGYLSHEEIMMRRDKNWYREKYGGPKTVKQLSHHQELFLRATVNSILHARRVCKREKHLNCATERIGIFVVSLRRELRLQSFDRDLVNGLCQYNKWTDAGVPSDRMDKERRAIIEEAYMQANAKEAKCMDDLNIVLEKEVTLIDKMKEVNKEADQLFADIKQLVSGL